MYNNRRRNFRSNKRRSNNRHAEPKKLDPNRLVKKASFVPKQESEYQHSFTFEQLPIPNELKKNIRIKGFTAPTPIQNEAIPHILEGRDVVGIANTGTGKTAAFLIPLLNKIHNDRRQKVLIIAPTRELAEQIDQEIFSLTRNMRVMSVLCVGGMSINKQIGRLKSNYNFVVGTPGRLIDLIERGCIRVNAFQNIVLDEVDRMLDMGFIQDIRSIISELPQNRHSLFFSATLDRNIEDIMNSFVRDYVKISVKTGETSDNVNQDVIYVRNKDEKLGKLEEMLADEAFKKVIVFVRTKIGVEKLDSHLYRKGYKVESLHGNKTQNRRKRALDAFKRGHASILIATDVAARGLDVPNVTHVVNFDMPATYEDYTHRIGRTGRGNQIGQAYTFIE